MGIVLSSLPVGRIGPFSRKRLGFSVCLGLYIFFTRHESSSCTDREGSSCSNGAEDPEGEQKPGADSWDRQVLEVKDVP